MNEKAEDEEEKEDGGEREAFFEFDGFARMKKRQEEKMKPNKKKRIPNHKLKNKILVISF